MNDFEVRRMISQPSWDVAIYQIFDDLVLQIPSPVFLEELIFFPKVGNSDPFNVEPYRIRPQAIELDSLLILQGRSNSIIQGIKERQLNPMKIDLEKKEFCEACNIDYAQFKFLDDSIEYIRKILPGVNLDVDLTSKMNTALAEIISKNIVSDGFFYLETHYHDVYKLMQKTHLTHESHRRRFSEYRRADDLMGVLTGEATPSAKLLSALLGECLMMHKNNEKLKRQRQKEKNGMTGLGFKDAKKGKILKKNKHEKHKNECKINEISVEGQIVHFKDENLVMPMNDVLAMVEDNKGTTISLDFGNKHVEVTDYRILAQCLFCNRFRLCEPSRVITRSCDRYECEKKERAWLQSLKPERKDIDIKTVSPSGF